MFLSVHNCHSASVTVTVRLGTCCTKKIHKDKISFYLAMCTCIYPFLNFDKRILSFAVTFCKSAFSLFKCSKNCCQAQFACRQMHCSATRDFHCLDDDQTLLPYCSARSHGKYRMIVTTVLLIHSLYASTSRVFTIAWYRASCTIFTERERRSYLSANTRRHNELSSCKTAG